MKQNFVWSVEHWQFYFKENFMLTDCKQNSRTEVQAFSETLIVLLFLQHVTYFIKTFNYCFTCVTAVPPTGDKHRLPSHGNR